MGAPHPLVTFRVQNVKFLNGYFQRLRLLFLLEYVSILQGGGYDSLVLGVESLKVSDKNDFCTKWTKWGFSEVLWSKISILV